MQLMCNFILVEGEDPVQALQTAFPELSPAHQRLLAWWNDKTPPGGYTVFEDVFSTFIQMLLVEEPSSQRDALLDRVFVFVEELLGSNDGQVQNLCYVALLEWQADWWYKRALPFLGPKARAELDEYFPEWRHHACRSDGRVPEREKKEVYLGDPQDVGIIVRQLLSESA